MGNVKGGEQYWGGFQSREIKRKKFQMRKKTDFPRKRLLRNLHPIGRGHVRKSFEKSSKKGTVKTGENLRD